MRAFLFYLQLLAVFPVEIGNGVVGTIFSVDREAGFVKRVQEPNSKGVLRNRYALSNTYLDFWYGCTLPNWSRLQQGLLSEDEMKDIMRYVDDVLVPKAFAKACREHMRARFMERIPDEKYIKTSIGGYEFDCIYKGRFKKICIKIFGNIGSRFTGEDLEVLYRLPDDDYKFYENEYYLFLNGRFSDKVWDEIAGIDNVNLIQPEWLIR